MTTTATEREEARLSGSRSRMSLGSRFLDAFIALAGMGLVVAVATVPLRPREQAIFATIVAIAFLIINRFKGKGATLFLVAISLSVSLRYMYWRFTETLDFPSVTEYVLGLGLVLAEFYAIVVLVLGYVQTIWPLDRKPMPLPDNVDLWPTVDVYIPTYNEPMTVVRGTVLAALAIDWPPEKIRVWLLDDGRREEFRQFAEDCGCGYITRRINEHAKAGNLNHAMGLTDAEYICVFDCDHIPTRAFLQMTMGWLVAEPNMAMVQTPHHFYSPDPFQRNLTAGTRVPSEGNLFYGLVQDGNDYWNACFFCGSCAVIRRAALDEINGFAIETVTEDAHTMLKLHRRGWDSAYLKLPLAGGLATERLMLHIGQRVRWARGMIQILRIDNPLFGRGLTVGQRICYLQATAHFLFAIPRVVFLTAPLAYLLLFQNSIAASPLAITAYALPHIFHAVATNSRVQRNWRHSFWSEIYETVLALFLVRVILATLLSPGRGKFNVTAKGGLLENGFFDLGAVYPNLILTFFLIAGVIRGLVGLIFGTNDTLTFQALLLNTIWASISLLIVMAALAVGRETRQIRTRARISATVPIEIHLPDGRIATGVTRDMSQGGSNVAATRPAMVEDGADVQIVFKQGDETILVPARVLRWDDKSLQVRWQPTTIEEEACVVRAVFGRADAWTDWSAFPVDRPVGSLWRVVVSIRGLFRPRDRTPVRPLTPDSGEGTAPTMRPVLSGPNRAMAGSALVAIFLLCMSWHVAAQPAPRGPTFVRPIPQLVPTLQAGPQPGTKFDLSQSAQPVAPPSPAFSPGTQTGAVQTSASSPVGAAPAVPIVPASAADGAASDPVDTPRLGVRHVTYNLRQLGATGPLALRGTSELQGVEFGIRADEVVTGAQLSITGAASPALIPEFSNVTVTMNEQYVGTIPITRDQPNFNQEMTVSPVFFQDNNRLNFRFTGRYTPECNDPLSGLLWATIYDSSTLTLTLERLPPNRDLARLPLPFFDTHEKQLLNLPFVMTVSPGNEALKAAAITASWFGQQATFRGATYPLLSEPPQQGNAVMVVVAGEGRAPSFLPAINGPTLAIIPNPNDRLSSILLIAGRNGEEAVAAATVLTVGSRALGTGIAVVQPADVPVRVAYDAPSWIATNRAVKFGEMVDASDLQVYGYVGLLHVPFRTAPDFYTWRNRAFPMNVKYRGPPGPIIDVAPSRMDVGINGVYLDSFSMAPIERRDSWFSRLFDFGVTQPDAHVDLPQYDVFGANDAQFFFDARPLQRGDCAAIPNDLRMSIDPDSTLDLSRGYRFAEMPNLAFFVNSGFPFTRMADLSRTAVVLPDRPSGVELTAFLNLMGRFGSLTGYPVLRVAIVRPDAVNTVADRDLLLMGTVQRLQGAAELLRSSAVRLSGNRLQLTLPSAFDTTVARLFGDRQDVDRQRAFSGLTANLDTNTAILVGSESPLSGGRSLVALLAGSPQVLETMVSTLRDTEQAPLLQGDLAIMTANKVTSYRVGASYTVGSLPFWLYPSWVLRDQPYAIVILMLIGCALLGFALYWALRRRANGRMAVRDLER